MVTLTSHTQSEQEMREALESNGQTVVRDAPVDPSEQSAEPVKAAAADGETAPPSEVGEKLAQETQTAPTAEKPAEPKTDQTLGPFRKERVKLKEQIGKLHDELDNERGDKTRLTIKLAAAEQELAKLKTPEAAAPKEEGTVKPKRPKLADFDFDQDKHDEAMDEYEAKLAQFNRDALKKEFDADRKAELEANKVRAQQEADAQKLKQFSDLVQADSKQMEDYLTLAEAMPEDPVAMPPAVEAVIEKSKRPALLIRHFMDDFLNHDAQELGRLAALDPVDQIWEMKQLEAKLVTEHEAKKATPAATVVDVPVAEKPQPSVTAPPKIKPPVAPPITSLGSRAASTAATLDKASSAVEYMKLRNSGVNR